MHLTAAERIADWLRRVEGARVLVHATNDGARVVAQQNGADADTLFVVLGAAYNATPPAPCLHVSIVPGGAARPEPHRHPARAAPAPARPTERLLDRAVAAHAENARLLAEQERLRLRRVREQARALELVAEVSRQRRAGVARRARRASSAGAAMPT